MDIRALCAAAAVVVGVGQAEAATVKYDLQYVGSYLENVWIFLDGAAEDTYTARLDLSDSPGPFPKLFPNAESGDFFQAYAEIEKDPEDPEGNPDIAPVCYVGSFNCSITAGDRAVYADPFLIVTDSFTVWAEATTLTVTSWGRYDGDGFEFSGAGYTGRAGAISSTFSIIELAPVPLPATAALLPLGIGALALLRRRRRT